MTAKLVLIKKFCELVGYTEKAVRVKIEEGKWVEGRQYIKAPDGRITIDMEGYYVWARSNYPPA